MMYWYGNGMNGWAYAAMGVGQLLFWGLLFVGMALLVRHLTHHHHNTATLPGPPTPEQLLAARFARGEIDEEEYRRRLTALREG